MRPNTRRYRLRLLALGAILAGAVIGSMPTAKADPADDWVFISVLDEQGITYTSISDAIGAGHAVCDYMDLGFTDMQTISLVVEYSGLGWYDAGYFVGASTAAFCPEYAPRDMSTVLR